MSTVFVIRNHNHRYLSKKDTLWLDGSEAQHVFKTPHHDIALNTLIEVNSQQIDVRASTVEVALDNKQQPILAVSQIEPTTTLASDSDVNSATED